MTVHTARNRIYTLNLYTSESFEISDFPRPKSSIDFVISCADRTTKDNRRVSSLLATENETNVTLWKITRATGFKAFNFAPRWNRLDMHLNRSINHLRTPVQRLEIFPRAIASCNWSLTHPGTVFSLSLSLSLSVVFPLSIRLRCSVSTTRSFNSNDQASYRRADDKQRTTQPRRRLTPAILSPATFFSGFATGETSCEYKLRRNVKNIRYRRWK